MLKISGKKKIALYGIAATIVLTAMAYFTLWLINIPYRSQIPPLPELQSLSAPLKEQILLADQTAHNHPTSDNLGLLGMVYHSSTYYDKAESCYKLAVKKNKKNWIWKYYLGYLSLEMGETKAAVSNFTAILKEHPKVLEAWYYIGEEYQNSGANAKAEEAYDKISDNQYNQTNDSKTSRNNLFPLNTYAQFQQARIYSNTKKFDKAELILKEIIKYNLYFGPAYRLLGNIYSSKGDSSWSKYNIIRANDLADYTPPVDTLIDQLSKISKSELYLLKQIDESEKSNNSEWTLMLLKNALTNISNNKYLISKAIKLYLKLDNGSLALPLLKPHLIFYKNDVNELTDIAGLLFDKGYYSQSLNYYSNLTNLKPDDSAIESGMAHALTELGKKTEAIELMAKLIEKNKKDFNTLSDGIQFMIEIGEKEKAKQYLRILKLNSPLNAKCFIYDGMLAELDGNSTLAISSYEQACKRDPNDISTIQYLGNILIQQQMWDKALIHLRKALEKHPNEPYLLERIGTLLVLCPDSRFRNYAVAREFSERAFINVQTPSKTMVSAGRSLAMAYAALGDKQKAAAYLNMIITIAKNENYPSEYLSDLESLSQHPSFKN